MKHFYTLIITSALCLIGYSSVSQCSSCTTTITGTDAANHIISSGQTFCISSTGTCTGLITVTSGGILCNQGNITSSNLWAAGGTINNYGTINTSNILASGQGVLNNYGTIDMDSLLITNIYSSMSNNGIINGIRMGNSDNASITNTGSIEVDYMADSIASFENYSTGSFRVNVAYANAYNSVCTNHGLFSVNDWYNSYSSTFTNNGYLNINHDFFNSTSSTFSTSCMVPVNHDWYNSATVTGPSVGCGGFNVSGLTYNSGTVGAATQPIDICDAGHPAGGLDGNIGAITSNTTYCSCGNACNPVGIAEPGKASEIISNVYPNPAVNSLSFDLNKGNGKISVEIYDMMGKRKSLILLEGNAAESFRTVDVSALAEGTYILSVIDESGKQSKNIFSIVR